MPGVNMPGQRAGLLDQVLKGVAIARDVYGIKHDMAATDAQNQAAGQSQAKFEDEQAGIVSPKDRLEWGRNYAPAKEGEDGAMPLKYRDENGSVLTTYVKSKDVRQPLPFHVDNAVMNGKHGTAAYDQTQMDPNDSSKGLLGFVQTDKPKNPPNSHFMPVTDPTTGKTSLLDTATGAITDPVGSFGKTAGIGPDGIDKKAISHEADKLYDTFIKGGARSEVGNLKAKIDIAENLKAIVDAHPDGDLPPPLQTELAIGMARMVGGAVPTEAEISKMDPQTKGSFIASMMQKFTNEPYGANNPGFVNLFAQTIDREKGIAHDQIGRTVQQAISFAPNLYKSDPKRFHGMVGVKQDDFQITPDGDVAYINKTIGRKGEAGKPSAGTAIASPAVPPPKTGDIHDGYKFKGGDPAVAANWEKQ